MVTGWRLGASGERDGFGPFPRQLAMIAARSEERPTPFDSESPGSAAIAIKDTIRNDFGVMMAGSQHAQHFGDERMADDVGLG